MRSFLAFLSLLCIASSINAQEDVDKDNLKENYNKENYDKESYNKEDYNKENYNKEDYNKENYNKEDYNGKDGDYNGKEDKEKSAVSIFAMEYLPIGHVRTDPIISQDCLSDHVHTFYGPPKIHPSVTYEELRHSTPETPHDATSGNVLENQSLYWHPTFYRKSADGATKEIVEPDWTTIYYAFQKGTTRSFPEGFRMIAGPFDLKPICYDYDKQNEKGKEKVTKNNVTNEEETSAYAALSHFPSKPCRELSVPLLFPTCWDGKNLDSNNHRNHMAYGIGLESGGLDTFAYGNVSCPKSHPVLLPQILLFLRFMDYAGDGTYELSNGDGVDWHADYIMGWEEKFLQSVMDDCETKKDIPCSSTRLRNIYGEIFKPDFRQMVDILQEVRVPTADTACISQESVNQIGTPPRGKCAGELISSDSCEQPEFPKEFLVSPVEDNKTSAGVIPSQGDVLLASVFLSLVLALV